MAATAVATSKASARAATAPTMLNHMECLGVWLADARGEPAPIAGSVKSAIAWALAARTPLDVMRPLAGGDPATAAVMTEATLSPPGPGFSR